MPRVLVLNDQGELAWCERVQAADFETEHFRDCLNERLRWAVSDAETRARAALIPPLRPTRLMRNHPDNVLEPV